MGYTLDAFGKPVFSKSPPQTVVDMQANAAFADLFAATRRGTEAEREALLPGQRREGMLFVATDTGYTYQVISGAFMMVAANIFGRVNRSATSLTLGVSAWANASLNALWTTDVARGLPAFANGWKVPVAGRYRVTWELRGNGVFAAGVSVNNATPNTAAVRVAQTGSLIQGVIALATGSGDVVLQAGDDVRLFGFASTGSPVLEGNTGFWSIQWVGAI